MRIRDLLLTEFEQEMPPTRRVLERVPSDKGEWKPHPRSFSLGHLAQLVSWMPSWIATTINEPALDLAGQSGYSYQPTETLLAGFDQGVKDARAALSTFEDSDFDTPWHLKHGDRVLFTSPRGATVETHINHLVHHRAQLGVYLRLLDIPVPQMYGPTADDRGFLA